MTPPTIADIEAARVRIAPYVKRTPVLTNEVVDARIGGRLFLKAESLQRFGAFKARGAFNRIASFTPEERRNGVLAFSSGNHAQAVAGAAREFGLAAVIVMPSDAPRVKVDNTRALGGEVVLYDRVSEDREAIGAKIVAERGLALVKPFDDPFVIAGQGTTGLELADDVDGLDVAFVPSSGGGLASGVALALTARFPGVRVYAVEPEGHDDVVRSLASGQREVNTPGVRSFCDALLSDRMGVLPFAIGREKFAGALAISDAAVEEAMRVAFREFKLVLEPGGAVALAAALSGKIDVKGARVGVIASGGNVDPDLFARVISGQ
ncbi:MAG: threonine dehydratase [Alphaproteobacteria bacterium]|nr:MAG: threonine dehydratase [Caulobacteraceae bacterium]TPW02317.1 MAG: threonine dehydratase [Alphaproteobacteria bacterium]